LLPHKWLPQMRVLILGGTGATGKALIGRLRQAGAADISVISRTATTLPGATRVLTGHYADIVPSAQFGEDLASLDAIVHLGDGLGVLQGGARAAGTAEADRLIATSERVAVAARDARVPLFVYVSSIKAICDEEDERVLVETSEPRPTTLYGQAKLRLERAVGTVLGGSATRHVIVRNPVMYSAGKNGSVHRLLQLADTPLPLPLGGLANKRSLLAVRNFADALATVVRAGPAAPAGVFHVHDGPPMSTTDIIATVRVALGRPARLFPIGTPPLRLPRAFRRAFSAKLRVGPRRGHQGGSDRTRHPRAPARRTVEIRLSVHARHAQSSAIFNR
jgi:nucleoside-diphosphate-sugar epimerase